MKHRFFVLKFLFAACFLLSCEKNFLEKKPDKALLVPETLDDFEYLLNNLLLMNNRSPYLHEVAADDYFTTDRGYTGMAQYLQDSYLWAPDGRTISFEDWTEPYRQVFYANIVLDGLKELNDAEYTEKYRKIRGGALFFRAIAMYNLLQQFAEQYDQSRANDLPGLPYPLVSDVNQRPGRSTLRLCYVQLIGDAEEAESLLPTKTRFPSEPSALAAKGLLMRIHLMMGNYVLAEQYATAFLEQESTLLDYNEVSAIPNRPFVPGQFNGNPEVIFYATFGANTYTVNLNGLTLVDTLLYGSYHEDDLRKTLFFRDRGEGQVNFRGSYSIGIFTGIATDEVYLVKAECLARLGDVQNALHWINALLIKRWKEGTYQVMSSGSKEEILELILDERRKELISRGLRWADLRRLNKESAFSKTIKRVVAGEEYVLLPNDKRYTFPIPNDEISLNDLEQNPQ